MIQCFYILIATVYGMPKGIDNRNAAWLFQLYLDGADFVFVSLGNLIIGAAGDFVGGAGEEVEGHPDDPRGNGVGNLRFGLYAAAPGGDCGRSAVDKAEAGGVSRVNQEFFFRPVSGEVLRTTVGGDVVVE